MKILITGAYGQLGSELKKLATGLNNLECYFTDFDTLDITDFDTLSTFFDVNSPDFVINCAAYTAVDLAEKEVEKATLLNSIAPGILASLCEKNSAKFIHISTDYVFDGMAYTPYTEENATNPQSVYGKTKREGELSVMDKNPQSIIIRTSWLYSTFGNNFVKTMIRLGKGRDHLRVVFDQIGTPTNASDLAFAILEIVSLSTSDETKWKPGIYHFSNEGVCSWYDFAIEVIQLAGISCKVEAIESKDFPTIAKRPAYSVLNKAKFKSAYGIEIPYWRHSLINCINHIQNNQL
jgi:dTDP-4-dehydrorhamnose reductase